MKFTISAAGLLLLALPVAHATNGYFLHGYGTKAKAEAGVGIAAPHDALTIATNPAGLAEVGDELSFGVDWFRPKRGATLVQGGQSARFDGSDSGDFFLPEIGYSHRLSDSFTVGVALYGNGGLDTDYRTNPFARFGARGPAGVDLQQAFLSPAVAWRINDSNSLGLAVNVAYQRFKAKGIGLFAGFSSDPANVSDRGKDSSSGVGVRIGWIGHIGDRVSLGATWQWKTSTGEFKKYAGLFADKGGFDVPETWGLGVSVKPVPAANISLDWQRINYAKIPSVGNSLALLFAGVPLGANGGPGFGWRNISVVKLGGDYAINDAFTVRAGVSHSQQPVPSSQTFFNVLAPGVIQDHATLGGSWRLSERNSLDVALLHAFRKKVNGSGSIPPSFGGGEVNIDLAETSLAFTFTHSFR
jgi:long-chain fatty acid transport protein